MYCLCSLAGTCILHFDSMDRLWLKWQRAVLGHADVYPFHGTLKFWDFASFKAFASHFDVPQAGAQEREEARELLQFIDSYAQRLPYYLALFGCQLPLAPGKSTSQLRKNSCTFLWGGLSMVGARPFAKMRSI